MQIAYVHHLNTRNIGDLVSAPYLYFRFSERPDGKLIDITADPDATQFDAVIYGGGAIAHHLRRPPRIKARKRIAWGVGRSVAGTHFHNPVPHEYPSGFNLLGIRDYWADMPAGAEWVPCASCMHPLFDQKYEVTRDVVGYFNRAKATPCTGIKDTMTNAHLIDRVLPFLGSAETVVTNSYHGAYWATLLNRKVIIVDPYSSKFFDLKWPHFTSAARRWSTALATHYPDALAEARAANEAFYLKVQGVLSNG